MNRRNAHRPKGRRRHRRRKGHPRLWHWVGLGALGVAAALLRRQRRPPDPSIPPSPPLPPEDSAPPLGEPPEDAEGSWILGPGGGLHLLELHPEGWLPMLFVHGLAGRASQWSQILKATGPAIRAIAFDLPGHGLSDAPANSDLGVPALAATLGAVLDSLGLRRTILVAHSLGALAAIEYAANRPERVAGLFLVDPAGDQTQMPESDRQSFLEILSADTVGEMTFHYRQLLLNARPGVADLVLEHLSSTPPDVLLSAFEGGTSYSPLRPLERYPGPIRNVVSDLNRLPSSLHRLVPELPTHHLDAASHWLMLDQPDELWSLLLDFMDEIALGDP